MSESETQRPKSAEPGQSDKEPSLRETEAQSAYPSVQPRVDATGGQIVKQRPVLARASPIVLEGIEEHELSPFTQREEESVAPETGAKVHYSSTQELEIAATPIAERNESAEGRSTANQTFVDGLIALLVSVRDEVRSQRVLLFSNLVLSFMIPLSALAVQNSAMFKADYFLTLQHPARWVFCLWAIGVLMMLGGLLFLLPSLTKGAEGMASHRAKEAARFFAAGKIDDAIKSVSDAIDEEYGRLGLTVGTRILFFGTFISFLLCVALEFAMVLFS
jgi:hypothetical protein